MTISRETLRTAAREFNQGPDRERLWADVLSTPDQIGASLTVYRRIGHGRFDALVRWTIPNDEATALMPVEPYGVPMKPDEQTAINELVAGIG